MRTLTVLTALLAIGCNKGPEPLTNLANQPGGDPLVPGVAMFPFPSDFYAEPDGATRTGRSLVFPAEALPADLLPATFAGMDGWPRAPVMLAQFPDGIDPASLPDPLNEAATLDPSSPVLVVREGTWELVPVLAELDAAATSIADQSLIMRAHRALEPDTGYVVLLRDGLQKSDGSGPIEAKRAFRALRDDIPTDSDAVESWREDFVLVNHAIAGLGLDPEEVVLGWSFHTRSREQVVNPLLSMTDQMMVAELPDLVIDSDEVISDNREIRGHITAPNFIGAEGTFVVDDDDRAIQQGTADIPFLLTIPVTVDETRPTVLFGHGFFSHMDEPTWGSLQQLIQPGRFPTISTMFIGFNEEDQGEAFALLTDFNTTIQLSAQEMQSEANHVILARLVREQLAAQITEDRGDGSFNVLDSEEVVYMGISNGGTQGFSIMATAPNLERGVLVVPGGALAHMLQRASPWPTLGSIIQIRFNTATELQIGTALSQLALDYWDSINFVDHLVEPRFEGRGPAKVVLHEAVGDAQVSNMITHWLARTAGVPTYPSTLNVWGLEELPPTEYDGNSALYIYDEGYDPLPIDNTPPVENGAHETIRDLEVYKTHVTDFIEEGRITWVCDGPCDPD